jgi:hypothetical protein
MLEINQEGLVDSLRDLQLNEKGQWSNLSKQGKTIGLKPSNDELNSTKETFLRKR